MRDPMIDDLIGCVVVPEGLQQELSPAIELPSEDAVWPVGLVERLATVLDGRPEVMCCVLVFESLDARALRPGEEEPDHHVVEAPVDEVVDNRTKFRLSAELFKKAHSHEDPDAMSKSDQVASLEPMSASRRASVSTRSRSTDEEGARPRRPPQAKVIHVFETLKTSVEESQASGKRKLKPSTKAAAKKSRKKKAASSKNKELS